MKKTDLKTLGLTPSVLVGSNWVQKMYLRSQSNVADIQFSIALAHMDFMSALSQTEAVAQAMSERGTGPEVWVMYDLFYRSAMSLNDWTGLSAYIKFPSGTRWVIESDFRLDTAVSHQTVYAHQIGNPQVFRLPSALMHPATIREDLQFLRNHSQATWMANLNLPAFLME